MRPKRADKEGAVRLVRRQGKKAILSQPLQLVTSGLACSMQQEPAIIDMTTGTTWNNQYIQYTDGRPSHPLSFLLLESSTYTRRQSHHSRRNLRLAKAPKTWPDRHKQAPAVAVGNGPAFFTAIKQQDSEPRSDSRPKSEPASSKNASSRPGRSAQHL